MSQESKLANYVAEMQRQFDVRIQNALSQIHADRLLLAVRGYLIALHGDRNVMAQKWVWSSDLVAQFWNSANGRIMRAELTAIIRHFNGANPGYTLTGGVERSLDRQIQGWNDNPGIPRLNAELKTKALKELTKTRPGYEMATPPYLPPPPPGPTPQSALPPKVRVPVYPDHFPYPSAPKQQSIQPPSIELYPQPPNAASLEAFKKFLLAVAMSGPPTSATPGLSDHGRCRAVDFTIKRGDVRIAAQGSAQTDWDTPGWTERLRQSVQAAGPHFVGPLPAPREPWHYTFRP